MAAPEAGRQRGGPDGKRTLREWISRPNASECPSGDRAEGDWLRFGQTVGHTVGRFGPLRMAFGWHPREEGMVGAKYDPEGLCVLRGFEWAILDSNQ